MPAGWAVTGLAWGGEPGARAIVVDCAGPAPLGGSAELVLVAEEPGTGVGCGYAGLPGLDPGDVIDGPSSVDVKAAGQHAPLWAIPTSDDRAAFVGEAYGVWLWLVMWPMNAAWLLAEQLELIDLRDRIYPDLPLGRRASTCCPAPERNATGSLMIGAPPMWQVGPVLPMRRSRPPHSGGPCTCRL